MFALILIYAICALVALIFLQDRVRNRRFYRLGSALPGPKILPLVGNLLHFAHCGTDFLKMLNTMGQTGGFSRFWLGNDLAVAIANPKYLESVYTSPHFTGRAKQYDPLLEILGKSGAVTAGGEQWKNARKLMVRTFNVLPIDFLATIMNRNTNKLLEIMREHVGKGFFSVAPAIHKSGCGTITEVALDSAQNVEMEKATNDIPELSRISILRTTSPLYILPAVFKRTAVGKKFYKMVQNVRATSDKIVMTKKKQYEEMKAKNLTPTPAVIYNILEKYPDLTLDTISDHILTTYAAGLDSTSASLAFALVVLGMHQDVQDAVRREDLELQESLRSDELTPTSMSHYVYLERVIKEVIRLYPPFIFSGRSTTDDVMIGDHLIPKNTSILVLSMYMHRNPDVYPNPLKFDPDRFLPENIKKVHQYAFTPFGGGERRCPGEKYSILKLKIEITSILREFKVISQYTKPEELEKNLYADIILSEKNGFQIRLENRHQSSC